MVLIMIDDPPGIENAGAVKVQVDVGIEVEVDGVEIVKIENLTAKFKSYDFSQVSNLRIGFFEIRNKVSILF